MSDDSKPSDTRQPSLDEWLKLSEEEQVATEPLVSKHLFTEVETSPTFVGSVMSLVAKETLASELTHASSWKREFLSQALPLQLAGAFASLFMFYQAQVTEVLIDSSISMQSLEFSSREISSDELSGILYGENSLEEFLPEFLGDESNV